MISTTEFPDPFYINRNDQSFVVISGMRPQRSRVHRWQPDRAEIRRVCAEVWQVMYWHVFRPKTTGDTDSWIPNISTFHKILSATDYHNILPTNTQGRAFELRAMEVCVACKLPISTSCTCTGLLAPHRCLGWASTLLLWLGSQLTQL